MIYLGDIDLEAVTGQGANFPLVGYHTVLTPPAISADALVDHPPRLMALPSTSSYWESDSADAQQVEFAAPGAFNYIGLARHNLGSAAITLTVEGYDGMDWTALTEELEPADDSPILALWAPAEYLGYRLNFGAGEAAPRIAVAYLGNILALPRKIYVGHTPVVMGVEEVASTGTSESGEFLGRLVMSEYRATQIGQANLLPAFYRASLRPWVESRDPFFFAWRPSAYPAELGYVWRTGTANPVNQRPNGMMSISLNVRGIA